MVPWGIFQGNIIRSCFLFLCLASLLFAWFLFTNPSRNRNELQDGYMHTSSHTQQLLNLEDFHFVIHSSKCTKDTFLVILVHSAPSHFELRNHIRNGYGHPSGIKEKVRAVFLLGVSNAEMEQLVSEEVSKYNDIVQGSFVDSYRNLTYKHIMGLKWAINFCTSAKFVLKMDDDIFVDIYQLTHYLHRHYAEKDGQLGMKNNTIACYIQKNMPVERNVLNKWHVSPDDYPAKYYETYCSGWAYLLNVNTAKSLVLESEKHRFFWIDDVFVTGILANALHIHRERLNLLYTIDNQNLKEWIESKGTQLLWKYFFGPVWNDSSLMKKGHEKATWCHEVNCTCCFRQKKRVWKPVSVQGIAYKIN